MAIDKDPSIYRDRGTIGSSDELDEYGVWVKSEPQVLKPDAAVEAVSTEPSLPDIEDLPDLDLDLGGSSPSSTEVLRLESEEALVPDFSDTGVFAVEDAPAKDDEPAAVFEDIGSFDAPAVEESFTELSMDDFLDDESAAPAAEAAPEDEDPLNIDLDFQEEESPALEPSAESFEFSGNKDESELETVSEFDDFLNGLSDSPAPASGAVVETSEAEISIEAIPETAAPTMKIDLDVQEEASGPEDDADVVSVDLSLSDGLPEIASEAIETDETRFDDVGDLDKDLEDVGHRSAPKMDLSTELLMRIADELSSIKTELSSLKTELGGLRGAVNAVEEPKPESHESAHGFFDEEDDETIALTGDELDNILNTADFTEEAGSDAADSGVAGLAFEEGAESFLSDKDDLLSDDAFAPPPEPVPEPVEAPGAEDVFADLAGNDDLDAAFAQGGDAAALDALVDIDIGPAVEKIELEEEGSPDEPIEMLQLREGGVKPMTPAPEDTSYLESEGDLADPIDLNTTESIDLTEAVIDEPDLGAFSIEEAAIEEPSIESLDLSVDLEAPAEEEAEEIVLSTEDFDLGAEDTGIEGSFEEVLPEGFVVEAEASKSDELPVEEIAEEIEDAPNADEADVIEEEELVSAQGEDLPANLRTEVKAVLSYMDQLLESLPESKIEEFAKSEYYETYRKLFDELGLA